MSNVLIINGAKPFLFAKGELNNLFATLAAEHLTALGHSVSTTVVDAPYSIDEEVQKIANSDVIIYQMPGWWMGEPWIVKRYIDEVFSAGHGVLGGDREVLGSADAMGEVHRLSFSDGQPALSESHDALSRV